MQGPPKTIPNLYQGMQPWCLGKEGKQARTIRGHMSLTLGRYISKCPPERHPVSLLMGKGPHPHIPALVDVRVFGRGFIVIGIEVSLKSNYVNPMSVMSSSDVDPMSIIQSCSN